MGGHRYWRVHFCSITYISCLAANNGCPPFISYFVSKNADLYNPFATHEFVFEKQYFAASARFMSTIT